MRKDLSNVGTNTESPTRTNSFEEDCLTFFRQCPGCKKRFQIKILGKEALESETVMERQPFVSEYFSGSADEYLELNETIPALIELEKFRYAYRCSRCGRQWTEIKESEVGTEKGSAD